MAAWQAYRAVSVEAALYAVSRFFGLTSKFRGIVLATMVELAWFVSWFLFDQGRSRPGIDMNGEGGSLGIEKQSAFGKVLGTVSVCSRSSLA